MSRFSLENIHTQKMLYEAIDEAFDTADISMEKVDAVFISNCEIESNGDRQRHTAPMLSSMLQKKIPMVTIPAGCGGGGAALWSAVNYQKENPDTRNMLVIGFEKLVANVSKKVTDEMLMGGERKYEQSEGLVFPAQNALTAQQYMMKYGATMDDYSQVALKNHDNAFDNPKAFFYKKKVTLDMIHDSPVVASPLRLFDCSIPCNGAASLILSKDRGIMEIAGSSLKTANLSAFEREDITSWESTVEAAKQSYTQAGITAKDIDVAEVHDAFTPVEVMAYEDLGFAKKGEGISLVRKKETTLSGKIPVNPSGGLKAKGHPLSCTGISQVYELYEQFSKLSEKRQIDNLTYGLTHNVGGTGSISSVHVFRKCG